MSKTKRRFTAEEDKIILNKKLTVTEMAEKTGRSITSINKRAAYLKKKVRLEEEAKIRLTFNGVPFEIQSSSCTVTIVGSEIYINTKD